MQRGILHQPTASYMLGRALHPQPHLQRFYLGELPLASLTQLLKTNPADQQPNQAASSTSCGGDYFTDVTGRNSKSLWITLMLVHKTLTISGVFLPSSLFTKQLHTEGQDKFVAHPHLTPTVSRLQWLLKSWNYQFYNVWEGFLSLRSRSQKLINKTPGIILFPHWGKYWHHHPGPQGSLIVPRTKKGRYCETGHKSSDILPQRSGRMQMSLFSLQRGDCEGNDPQRDQSDIFSVPAHTCPCLSLQKKKKFSRDSPAP